MPNSEELDCQHCQASLRRFLLDPYQCRGRERFCESFDRALINLAAKDGRGPLSWQTYQQMSQSILYGHGALVADIGAGEFTYPTCADDFIDLIVTFHYRLFGGTGLSFAGQLRREEVQYGSGRYQFAGVSPSEVRTALVVLFGNALSGRELQRLTQTQFTTLSAQFLHSYFVVHPFADGNGRTGRLFLLLMARASGSWDYHTFETSGKWRARYRAALRFADRHCGRVPLGDGRPRDCGTSQHPAPYAYLARWLDSHLLERDWDEVLEEEPPPGFG